MTKLRRHILNRKPKGHAGTLKPNGYPVGTFTITIDDGFCAWASDLTPRFKHASIALIEKRIVKAFRTRLKNPRLVR